MDEANDKIIEESASVASAKYDAASDSVVKEVVITTTVATPFVNVENEYRTVCTEIDALLAKKAELEAQLNLKK